MLSANRALMAFENMAWRFPPYDLTTLTGPRGSSCARPETIAHHSVLAEAVATANFDPAHVGLGSDSDMSMFLDHFPLRPYERTSPSTNAMSEKCQKRMFLTQSKIT